MISVNQLTVQFSGIDLFKNITFLINAKDKIGLAGKNGAGKSTMLKVLTGELEHESGTVSMPKDITIGYLPQQMTLAEGKTVFEEAISSFSEINYLHKKIAEITHQLETRTDYESEEYTKLIEKLTDYNDRLAMSGGAGIDGEAEQTLLGLGFERSDFERQTTEFSGGWRMRIELAKILLQKPAVLLLDEPTNHLDIESIQWLESFLKTYSGALVLISHDRTFLDAVTHRTIEISLGRIYDYKASYSKYLTLRAERITQQRAAYENQQKMIEDTEKFIERFRYQATKAVQVQSRIKQLEKVERIEIENEDTSSIQFRFPPAPRSGTIVVEANDCTKQYGEKTILEDVEIIVERGQKVAFVGRNGEGKSTFSKMIMNEIDFSGSLKIGHNVKIGYFAQNQDELLDGDRTVLQTLDDIAVGDIRTKIRDILGSFLFSGEDVDKKVKVLSGGERNRLAMAKLLLEPYNLLLLDEPTNHLDIRSKDILKQAIQQYDGTVILVSHDRDFLDGLASHVYEFRNKKIKEHIGGIHDFLEKKKLSSMQSFEKKTDTQTQKAKTEEPTNQSAKQSYQQRKDQEKEIKKLQNQIKKAEREIETLEEELSAIAVRLENPDNHDDSIYEQHQATENALTEAMEKWELLSGNLETLQE